MLKMAVADKNKKHKLAWSGWYGSCHPCFLISRPEVWPRCRKGNELNLEEKRERSQLGEPMALVGL